MRWDAKEAEHEEWSVLFFSDFVCLISSPILLEEGWFNLADAWMEKKERK